MTQLLGQQTRLGLSSGSQPLALGICGLCLLALQPLPTGCDPMVLGTLLIAAATLAPLAIQLTGAALPLSLLPLTLVPMWLLCGAWLTAAVALVGVLAARLGRAPTRLPAARQVAASLAGVGLGALLGTVGTVVFPTGVVSEAARATGFTLGLWIGQAAAEWLSPARMTAVASWPAVLLTNLVLLPPGLLLAQIGSRDEPVFVLSAALAVGLLILVRSSTNSDTRTTELEAKAASAASARDHLELIMDQAPEAIIGIDAAGTVRWLNRTAAEWLGEQAEAVVGQPAELSLPVRTSSGDPLDHARLLARSASEGHPLHEEGLLSGAPGAPERVVASYSAAADPSGTDLGLILLRDAAMVTDSLREQEDLAVHLSHELRAPLTTILGYAQLMANPNRGNLLPNAQSEFAQRISESGDYMLRLVNNLLDLGRLSRSDADDHVLSQVDVVAATRDVVLAHRPQAHEKAQELVFQEPSGPIHLVTSDLAIRQILTNLLANAIKYTPPEGHVRVTLSESPMTATWQVIDDGIGLSPDEQTKLFTKFFRSQRPEARLIKGTGLGLALTKALVERLGGTIEVESAVDRGSTFTVRLPREAPASGS